MKKYRGVRGKTPISQGGSLNEVVSDTFSCCPSGIGLAFHVQNEPTGAWMPVPKDELEAIFYRLFGEEKPVKGTCRSCKKELVVFRNPKPDKRDLEDQRDGRCGEEIDYLVLPHLPAGGAKTTCQGSGNSPESIIR